MAKVEVNSKGAPEAIGPYSQAIRAGNFLFLSGSIPVDPGTGEVSAGSVEEQTRRVLKNIEAVLKEAGCGVDSVVRTTVFLRDITTFTAMNGVYGEFFSPPYPARSTVEVGNLPKGVKLEIDAIAVLPG